MRKDFGGGEGNFSDFFESIFGSVGGFGGGGRKSTRQSKGHDLQTEMDISLEED